MNSDINVIGTASSSKSHIHAKEIYQQRIQPTTQRCKGIVSGGNFIIGINHFFSAFRGFQYFFNPVYIFTGKITVHYDEIKSLWLNIFYEGCIPVNQQRLFKVNSFKKSISKYWKIEKSIIKNIPSVYPSFEKARTSLFRYKTFYYYRASA